MAGGGSRGPGEASPLPALDLSARLLYRDALALIIDKPAGLPVHAGPKGGANLEAYFDQLRFGLPQPPALAHRLDRDTSGCLVLGRHRQALAKLGRLFAAGAVLKIYWAIVIGAPAQSTGRIELPLAKRSTAVTGWWMKVDAAGAASVTDYSVLGLSDGLAWLELTPRTGRTHQLRVHCEALGCPILGDPIYGSQLQPSPLPPLQLHARKVSLPLYPARPPIAAEAPLPAHMLASLAACGYDSADHDENGP